ncbi:hypothetical protein OIU34_23235 [Pararhizobium sp. BT-229]|uniref:hypothetical protein n=1 Tax=Pararhizobium sp. BT-229 TaxID=2986923 RepID=UPI0021F7D3C0|nr:hypothetical protein [Pararhizobium sp. BT-229]MCV9964810.1 hypothetical protein [Pararhizobium sp. BT-229]
MKTTAGSFRMDTCKVFDIAFHSFILSVALVLGSACAIPAFWTIYLHEPWMQWVTTRSFMAIFLVSHTALFVSLGTMVTLGFIYARRKWLPRK